MTDHMWLPETRHLRHQPTRNNHSGMAGGGHKVMAHTTEGFSDARSCASYLERVHYDVNFVSDPIHKLTLQCLPLNLSGAGLQHPAGTMETNRANVEQIEILAFAEEATARQYGYDKKWAVANWGESEYEFLAHLLYRIHKNFSFPLKNPSFRHPKRMGQSEFYDYSGLVGHCHAASQPGAHSDPGVHFRGKHLLHLVRQLVNG